MAVSQDGIKINMNFEALENGEGVIVRMSTSVSVQNDDEKRRFLREGQSQDIFGQRLNVHEPSFADAKTRLATAIDNFASEVQTLITDWNAGVYDQPTSP